MTPKPPTQTTAYKILVQKTLKEFAEMGVFLKNRITLGHWRVGRGQFNRCRLNCSVNFRHKASF